jgi:hypothetical protein
MGRMFATNLAWYKQVYGRLLPHALVIGEDYLYTSKHDHAVDVTNLEF